MRLIGFEKKPEDKEKTRKIEQAKADYKEKEAQQRLLASQTKVENNDC